MDELRAVLSKTHGLNFPKNAQEEEVKFERENLQKYILALVNPKYQERHFGILKSLKGVWFKDPL